MGSSQFFISYLLVIALLAILRNHTTAQENDSSSPTGFNAAEGDALLAFKHEFNNSLTGSIPALEQPSLRFFNASCNKLSVTNTKDGKPKKHRSTMSPYIVIFVVVDVLGLVFIVSLLVVYNRKSKKIKGEIEGGYIVDEEKVESLEIIREESVDERGGGERSKLMFMDSEAGFGLRDLMRASAVGLGKGSFGTCYKAQLENGGAVAVKRLRDLRSTLTREEFGRQSQVIASQKHPNLLPLLACFYSREEKLLLYKFARNGNVYNRIHGGRGTKDRIPFRWSARLSVARGVARALEYLHTNPTNSQPPIVPPHGNLKSSNVLLDENEVVLVSDYYLTPFVPLHVAARRMVSYTSPEYQTHKRVSKKSDVWSYGIFLLELLTGRGSSHSAPPLVDGVDLGRWVHRAVREEWTEEIFDVEIAAQRSATHPMLRLLGIAFRCSDESPEKRPEMSEVVREFENIKVVVDSEDEDGDGDGDEDDFSYDQSLTDDSMSGDSPIVLSGGDER